MQHITIPAWTDEKYARQYMFAPGGSMILILRLFGTKEKKHEVYMYSKGDDLTE